MKNASALVSLVSALAIGVVASPEAVQGEVFYETGDYSYEYDLVRNYDDPETLSVHEGGRSDTTSIDDTWLDGDITVRAQGAGQAAITGGAADCMLSAGARSQWALAPAQWASVPEPANTRVDRLRITSEYHVSHKFRYDGGEMRFEFVWDGQADWEQAFPQYGLDPVTVEFGEEGYHEYGYRVQASASSDTEDYWVSVPELGGQWNMELLDESETITDLSTTPLMGVEEVIAGSFSQQDNGKTFWLQLSITTFVEGGGYTVTGDGLLSNDMDFMNTFGVTSAGGASAVPEPATLALVALGGFGLLARRRRKQAA